MKKVGRRDNKTHCPRCKAPCNSEDRPPRVIDHCNHIVCKACIENSFKNNLSFDPHCPLCQNDGSSKKERMPVVNSTTTETLPQPHDAKKRLKRQRPQCHCGSNKINVVCLSLGCASSEPCCFDCAGVRHRACKPELIVNKKKGFGQQIQMSPLLEKLYQIEKELKRFVSKEIARLQNLLVRAIEASVSSISEFQPPKCFDFDSLRSSLKFFEAHYSSKDKRVVVNLKNEEETELRLASFVTKFKDTFKEQVVDFSKSVRKLKGETKGLDVGELEEGHVQAPKERPAKKAPLPAQADAHEQLPASTSGRNQRLGQRSDESLDAYSIMFGH